MDASEYIEIGLSLAKVLTKGFLSAQDKIFKVLSEKAEKYLGEQEIGYAEILRYMLQQKKLNQKMKQAIVIKQAVHRTIYKGYEIYVVCLDGDFNPLVDSNSELVCRMYCAEKIKQDLLDLFSGKDVIVFK